MVDPTQRLVFLGIQLDTVHNTMCLDPPKRQELCNLLHHISSKRVSRSQLERLAGILNWAAGVIPWGRTQLYPLYQEISQLSSDASQHAGGAFCHGDWFFCNWSLDFPHLAKSHINIKELSAIAVALQGWAPALHGHHVVVLTDSTCAAGMLNKGSSSHRTALDLLKQIAKCCLTYNIAI